MAFCNYLACTFCLIGSRSSYPWCGADEHWIYLAVRMCCEADTPVDWKEIDRVNLPCGLFMYRDTCLHACRTMHRKRNKQIEFQLPLHVNHLVVHGILKWYCRISVIFSVKPIVIQWQRDRASTGRSQLPAIPQGLLARSHCNGLFRKTFGVWRPPVISLIPSKPHVHNFWIWFDPYNN